MRRYLAELLGTFFLVLTVVVAVGESAELAALAIGSVLMVMVYAVGHISGAHYNPAVSLATLIRGRLSPVDLLAYWAAQLVGALLGAFIGDWLVNEPPVATLEGDMVWKALVVELLFTFALAYVVLSVVPSRTNPNNYYGLAIGFTVIAGAVAMGPISGAAFNPAVAFGASVAGLNAWGTIWIYLIACLAAGALAGFAFRVFNPEDA